MNKFIQYGDLILFSCFVKDGTNPNVKKQNVESEQTTYEHVALLGSNGFIDNEIHARTLKIESENMSRLDQEVLFQADYRECLFRVLPELRFDHSAEKRKIKEGIENLTRKMNLIEIKKEVEPEQKNTVQNVLNSVIEQFDSELTVDEPAYIDENINEKIIDKKESFRKLPNQESNENVLNQKFSNIDERKKAINWIMKSELNRLEKINPKVEAEKADNEQKINDLKGQSIKYSDTIILQHYLSQDYISLSEEESKVFLKTKAVLSSEISGRVLLRFGKSNNYRKKTDFVNYVDEFSLRSNDKNYFLEVSDESKEEISVAEYRFLYRRRIKNDFDRTGLREIYFSTKENSWKSMNVGDGETKAKVFGGDLIRLYHIGLGNYLNADLTYINIRNDQEDLHVLAKSQREDNLEENNESQANFQSQEGVSSIKLYSNRSHDLDESYQNKDDNVSIINVSQSNQYQNLQKKEKYQNNKQNTHIKKQDNQNKLVFKGKKNYLSTVFEISHADRSKPVNSGFIVKNKAALKNRREKNSVLILKSFMVGCSIEILNDRAVLGREEGRFTYQKNIPLIVNQDLSLSDIDSNSESNINEEVRQSRMQLQRNSMNGPTIDPDIFSQLKTRKNKEDLSNSNRIQFESVHQNENELLNKGIYIIRSGNQTISACSAQQAQEKRSEIQLIESDVNLRFKNGSKFEDFWLSYCQLLGQNYKWDNYEKEKGFYPLFDSNEQKRFVLVTNDYQADNAFMIERLTIDEIREFYFSKSFHNLLVNFRDMLTRGLKITINDFFKFEKCYTKLVFFLKNKKQGQNGAYDKGLFKRRQILLQEYNALDLLTDILFKMHLKGKPDFEELFEQVRFEQSNFQKSLISSIKKKEGDEGQGHAKKTSNQGLKIDDQRISKILKNFKNTPKQSILLNKIKVSMQNSFGNLKENEITDNQSEDDSMAEKDRSDSKSQNIKQTIPLPIQIEQDSKNQFSLQSLFSKLVYETIKLLIEDNPENIKKLSQWIEMFFRLIVIHSKLNLNSEPEYVIIKLLKDSELDVKDNISKAMIERLIFLVSQYKKPVHLKILRMLTRGGGAVGTRNQREVTVLMLSDEKRRNEFLLKVTPGKNKYELSLKAINLENADPNFYPDGHIKTITEEGFEFLLQTIKLFTELAMNKNFFCVEILRKSFDFSAFKDIIIQIDNENLKIKILLMKFFCQIYLTNFNNELQNYKHQIRICFGALDNFQMQQALPRQSRFSIEESKRKESVLSFELNPLTQKNTKVAKICENIETISSQDSDSNSDLTSYKKEETEPRNSFRKSRKNRSPQSELEQLSITEYSNQSDEDYDFQDIQNIKINMLSGQLSNYLTENHIELLKNFLTENLVLLKKIFEKNELGIQVFKYLLKVLDLFCFQFASKVIKKEDLKKYSKDLFALYRKLEFEGIIDILRSEKDKRYTEIFNQIRVSFSRNIKIILRRVAKAHAESLYIKPAIAFSENEVLRLCLQEPLIFKFGKMTEERLFDILASFIIEGGEDHNLFKQAYKSMILITSKYSLVKNDLANAVLVNPSFLNCFKFFYQSSEKIKILCANCQKWLIHDSESEVIQLTIALTEVANYFTLASLNQNQIKKVSSPEKMLLDNLNSDYEQLQQNEAHLFFMNFLDKTRGKIFEKAQNFCQAFGILYGLVEILAWKIRLQRFGSHDWPELFDLIFRVLNLITYKNRRAIEFFVKPQNLTLLNEYFEITESALPLFSSVYSSSEYLDMKVVEDPYFLYDVVSNILSIVEQKSKRLQNVTYIGQCLLLISNIVSSKALEFNKKILKDFQIFIYTKLKKVLKIKKEIRKAFNPDFSHETKLITIFDQETFLNQPITIQCISFLRIVSRVVQGENRLMRDACQPLISLNILKEICQKQNNSICLKIEIISYIERIFLLSERTEASGEVIDIFSNVLYNEIIDALDNSGVSKQQTLTVSNVTKVHILYQYYFRKILKIFRMFCSKFNDRKLTVNQIDQVKNIIINISNLKDKFQDSKVEKIFNRFLGQFNKTKRQSIEPLSDLKQQIAFPDDIAFSPGQTLTRKSQKHSSIQIDSVFGKEKNLKRNRIVPLQKGNSNEINEIIRVKIQEEPMHFVQFFLKQKSLEDLNIFLKQVMLYGNGTDNFATEGSTNLMLFSLRLFKAFVSLGAQLDKEKDSNEKEVSIEANKRRKQLLDLGIFQLILTNCQVFVRSPEVFRETLTFAIELFYGDFIHCQNAFLKIILQEGNAFFIKLMEKMQQNLLWLSNQLESLRMKYINKYVTRSENFEIEHNGLDSEMEETILLFKFLTKLCRGHFSSLQNYLRGSTNTKSKASEFNFLELSMSRFSLLVKFINPHTVECAICLVEFMISAVEGPCVENQKLFLNLKILDVCKDLFLSFKDRDKLSIWGFFSEVLVSRLQLLVFRTVRLINALFEGANDLNEIANHLSVIDVGFIVRSLTIEFFEICPDWKKSFTEIVIQQELFTKEKIINLFSCSREEGPLDSQESCTSKQEPLKFEAQHIDKFYEFKEGDFLSKISYENFDNKIESLFEFYVLIFLILRSCPQQKALYNQLHAYCLVGIKFFEKFSGKIEIQFNERLINHIYLKHPCCFFADTDLIKSHSQRAFKASARDRMKVILGKSFGVFNQMKYNSSFNRAMRRVGIIFDVGKFLNRASLGSVLVINFYIISFFGKKLVNGVGVENDLYNQDNIFFKVCQMSIIFFNVLRLIFWFFNHGITDISTELDELVKQTKIKDNHEKMMKKKLKDDKEFTKTVKFEFIKKISLMRFKEKCDTLYDLYKIYLDLINYRYIAPSILVGIDIFKIITKNPIFLYSILLTIISIYSLIFKQFFTYGFFLLEVAKYFPTINRLLDSIIINKFQILSTIIIMSALFFCFAIAGFQFLASDFYNITLQESTCSTAIQCFLFIFSAGPRNSGSIGDQLALISLQDPMYYYLRWLFDILMWGICNLILMNIMFGIIVDSFAEIRNDISFLEKLFDNTCVVCSLDRPVFEKENLVFTDHQNQEHLVDNYIFFTYGLSQKKKFEMTGIESYINQCFSSQNIDWIPFMNTIALVGKKKKFDNEIEMYDRISKKITEIKNIQKNNNN